MDTPVKLIGEESSILEQAWQEEQKILSVAFPLYEKNRKSKLRKKMRFVEPTSFKCRRRLLTPQEEESIRCLVHFLRDEAAAGAERVSADQLATFFSTRNDSDFLKSVCEIAQCTVNNFITDSFYMPLDDALVIFNASNLNVEYHIDRHRQHGIDFLLRKLHLFLFKYSNQPHFYLEGIWPRVAVHSNVAEDDY